MAASKSNQGAWVDQNQGAWNESEAAAGGETYSETATDGFKGAETLARISTFRNTIIDGIKGAESIPRRSNMLSAASDGSKISEALARIISGTRTATDGAIFTDASARTSNLKLSASDGYKFAEPLSPQTAYASSLTVDVGSVESGTLSDTIAADANYLKLNEISGAPPGFDYTFNFTGIIGTPERVVFRGRYEGNAGHVVYMQAYDNIGATWVNLARIVHATSDSTYSEILNESKYVSAGAVKIRFLHTSPGANTHDLYVDQIYIQYRWGIDAVLSIPKTLNDGVIVSDSPAVAASFSLTATDGAMLSDAAARRLNIYATLSDGAKLSDVLAIAAVLLPSISDGFKLSETLTATTEGLFDETITDGFMASESLATVAQFIRALSDQFNLSESLASILSAAKALSDGISISDITARILTARNSASDGFVFTDISAGDLVTAIIQALASDGFTFSDATQTRADFDITVTDGAKFSETISTIMAMLSAAADALKISDIATITTETILASGLVRITFSGLAGGKMVFTVRKPSINFTVH